MARIQINDLPPLESLTPEELEQIFGAGLKTRRLLFESLESRKLFSVNTFPASDLGAGGLPAEVLSQYSGGNLYAPSLAMPLARPQSSASSAVGFAPYQVRKAYGIDQISFPGVTANGAGQTIGIVDAYNDANIVSDLDLFDQTFGAAQTGPTLYQQYGAARRSHGLRPERQSDQSQEHHRARGSQVATRGFQLGGRRVAGRRVVRTSLPRVPIST